MTNSALRADLRRGWFADWRQIAVPTPTGQQYGIVALVVDARGTLLAAEAGKSLQRLELMIRALDLALEAGQPEPTRILLPLACAAVVDAVDDRGWQPQLAVVAVGVFPGAALIEQALARAQRYVNADGDVASMLALISRLRGLVDAGLVLGSEVAR